jgi:hypothetical protein
MLHHDVSPRTVGLARIWVYGLWLWPVLTFPVAELAELPGFQPIGVLRLLPSPALEVLRDVAVLRGLQAITLSGLVLLVLGLGPYYVIAIGTCVLLTISQGLMRGFGHVCHNELALLYASYVLAVIPAADAVALGSRRVRLSPPAAYAAAMFTIALVLCLTYAFVGVRRLASGGLSIFLNDTILNYMVLRDAECGSDCIALGHYVLEYPWLATLARIGFPLVTFLEVLSPLTLFYAPLRRIWIAVMLPFHLGSGLMMNIWFPFNMMLIMFFLTDINRCLARIGVPPSGGLEPKTA